MIDLSGRTILVTGSSKGIGKQICITCADLGAQIISHVRSANAGHQSFITGLPKYDGRDHVVFECDLSDINETKNRLLRLIKEYQVDGLVNNAGITHNSILAMTRLDDLDNQFKINTTSPFLIIQLLSKRMIRNKHGSIVNVVSTAAFDGNQGKIAYGASKAGLVAMTQSMSRELGPHNVRVNAIAPGITNTSMLSSMTPEVIADAVENSDLGRAAEPEDIANIAAFLLSDSSSYITGETIRVDGGMF